MLSRQSSFILEKSVISSSSSFLSFSYLQYVHQSSSNESGLIRWAMHIALILYFLFRKQFFWQNRQSRLALWLLKKERYQFVFFFSLFLLLAVRASIELKWIWSDQMGSAQWSDFQFLVQKNRKFTSYSHPWLTLVTLKVSVRLLLFSLSPTCSTCIKRAQMNLVWSDGHVQCTLIWFLVFSSGLRTVASLYS